MPVQYAAIIPCYNVGKACIPVVTQTASQVHLCVAVNDGSTDDTRAILEDLKLTNVRVLSHQNNLGKGTALLTGFRFVLQEAKSIQAILTLDGDGQHDPSYIKKFKQVFEEIHPDLIYGNRMLNLAEIPTGRRLLNRFSNWLMTRICRQQIFDSQCGFRLHSRKLLGAILDDLHTGRYVLETEILIKACREGFKIAVIPISTIYSEQSNVLSHHSLFDVLRIGRLMVSYYFRRHKS